jgi:hypothetical protein
MATRPPALDSFGREDDLRSQLGACLIPGVLPKSTFPSKDDRTAIQPVSRILGFTTESLSAVLGLVPGVQASDFPILACLIGFPRVRLLVATF